MLEGIKRVNSDLFLPGKGQIRGTKLTRSIKIWEIFGFGKSSAGFS